MKNILVSLAVAFVMLVIVTWNWVISLLGLINIACIVVFFLAVFPMLGWTLDLFNTIFLIMSVGLSVLSGAGTTLLSAIPLFGCVTIFFNRFGTFIFIIIFPSISLALFLLVSLLL